MNNVGNSSDKTDAVKILVVDDDLELLTVMEESLKATHLYEVSGSHRAEQAIELLRARPFDIVITDFSLDNPSINGLAILEIMKECSPEALGVIVTAYASLEISLQAIKLGAYDFLTKPFQIEELMVAVRNGAEQVKLRRENERLKAETSRLARTIEQIGVDHRDLMIQLRSFNDTSAQVIPVVDWNPSIKSDQVSRIQAYLRVGESIGDRLEQENRRFRDLHKEGIIDQYDCIEAEDA